MCIDVAFMTLLLRKGGEAYKAAIGGVEGWGVGILGI